MPISLNGSSGILGGINSTSSQSATGSSAVTFTGIPNTAKRITMNVFGITTGATGAIGVQVGSGGLATSGYTGSTGLINGGTGQTGNGGRWGYAGNLGGIPAAQYIITNIVGTNTWVCSGQFSYDSTGGAWGSAIGYITLGGALDRVAFTLSSGTFTGGTVQVYYE